MKDRSERKGMEAKGTRGRRGRGEPETRKSNITGKGEEEVIKERKL